MLPKQNVILGISLLCLGLLIAPLYDALAKYLSEDIHILEIIWARFFSHFIFLVPLVYFIKGKKLFFIVRIKKTKENTIFLTALRHYNIHSVRMALVYTDCNLLSIDLHQIH